MSHEPHPRTDATSPGSTPGDRARPNVELERQRAEGEFPGQPTRDALRDDTDDVEEEPQTQGRVEVPPTESVPDDVAAEAARSLDPDPTAPRDRDRDLDPDDAMRPSPSTSDVRGMPGGDQGGR